jgi:hypothetical protein
VSGAVNLAWLFKAGNDGQDYFASSRQRRLNLWHVPSIIADATRDFITLSSPALKRRAKFISPLTRRFKCAFGLCASQVYLSKFNQ